MVSTEARSVCDRALWEAIKAPSLHPPAKNLLGSQFEQSGWMRFSAVAVVGLLHFAGSAQAFSSLSGARFVSQRPRVLPALRAVNEFDAWWAVRGAQTRDAPGALPLSTDSVALVLTEFASSDFARRLCKPGSVDRTNTLMHRHVHCMHHHTVRALRAGTTSTRRWTRVRSAPSSSQSS